EMDVQYQIILWIEAPRHPGRLLPWRSARFPKEEMAIGIEGLAFERQIHAREAFAPGCLTETRRAGPIDQQVRMMHGVCVARTDLYGLHIARLAETGREDEIPEGVGTMGRRCELLLGGDDEIGRTKLPTVWEFGRRGTRRWPLGHVRLHPRFYGLDLCIGEPAFVLKFAVSRFGQPRRHVATPRDGYDLRRVFPGV